MPKTTLAELLLALLAGRERAAAIYGDLLELAAARPRASFWSSYFVTLLSLSWRPLTAFLSGGLVFAMLWDRLGFPIFLFAITHSYSGAPIADTTILLWFLVPFSAVMYGIRDRDVQLALAASLVAPGVMVLDAGLGDRALAVCVAFVVIAAMCMVVSRGWRRPLISLVVSCAVGVATQESLDHIGKLAMPAIAAVDMVAVCLVFSWMHHHLRRPRSAMA